MDYKKISHKTEASGPLLFCFFFPEIWERWKSPDSRSSDESIFQQSLLLPHGLGFLWPLGLNFKCWVDAILLELFTGAQGLSHFQALDKLLSLLEPLFSFL